MYVFSNPPRELDIEAEYITDNPLVVIAPKHHLLAKQQNIGWDKLSCERILMREVGSGTRYAIERFLQSHDLTISRPITIASNEAIKESVMAGLGLGIVSRHALNHMTTDNLVELDVMDFPIANHWYWVSPKGKHRSAISEAFKKFVSASLK